MNPAQVHIFETFLKEISYERNGKKYTAKKQFSQAYAMANLSKLPAADYFEIVHPWLAVRYAFDWTKDRYSDVGFWKDVNHQWEEHCIRKKIATTDELSSLTVDELKQVSRDLFGNNQLFGETPADAMDYFREHIEELEEIKRKQKAEEEARLERERQKHIENQKKKEEERKRQEEEKKKQKMESIINPIYTSSLSPTKFDAFDDDDDEDFIILNSAYANRSKIQKGEIRVETSDSRFRLTFSAEDSAEISASGLQYLCLKKSNTLVICNDANRGVKVYKDDGKNSIRVNSKVLVEYLNEAFAIKSNNVKMRISNNISVNPNVLAYQIISVVQ